MQKLISLLSLFLIVFITNTFAQNHTELINNFLHQELFKSNWVADDISDWSISDNYFDKSSGLSYVYIQQQYKSIFVYNAISVFVIRNDSILHFTPGIVDHLSTKVNSILPAISPKEAIDYAIRYLEKPKERIVKQKSFDAQKGIYEYEVPGISNSLLSVQLVYTPVRNRLVLSWNVSIDMKSDQHWWNIRIDAQTGEFISKNDFTDECDFSLAEMDITEEMTSQGAEAALLVLPPPAMQYHVFALPVEAPSFGSRTLITDPADVQASPYGWHDVDGIPGSDYTITRGNNVYAYEDANSDDQPGYSPDGGGTFDFDFPFTNYGNPIANMDASLTNLFYTCNRVHDYLYPLGFTEGAGNFQQNNYGHGGLGNDFVKAEGFDGSGTNNANFSTPPDGISGTMQMYLWNGNPALCTSLSISSSLFNGNMAIGTATFSGIGTASGGLILVNDGVGVVTDACQSITNNIAGKIALIDRGICNYINKAQAAQSAGAIGVIIANNVSGIPPGMTGSPQLAIPVVSISLADGNLLKSLLQSTSVNATINTCASNQIDASFDNGIIIHEYGHGVSNRLTGGPSHSGCLENDEQGGEGWSDWLALVLTIEPGDVGENARGMATYAFGQLPSGAGIRRYPYSTDMNINPQTYSHLALSSEVHRVGEIWCDAIWDMTWLLINQYGFSSDASNSTAGNNIAIRLVLEGMKLQPCGPGFLDARDAILTADAILYNHEHRCKIWEAFARRGMGFNASQGSANVVGDEIENFDMPPYCLPAVQQPTAAFATDNSDISCGGKVSFTDQSAQAFDWYWDFGDQSSSNLQNPTHTYTSPGTFAVKLKVTNPLGVDSLVQNINVTPGFSVSVNATPTTICQGETVELNSEATGATNRSYHVTSIPYAPVAGTGTSVSLGDDQMSTSKPIGFTFNFFGIDYTDFYICSNGFITFSPAMPPRPVYGEAIPFYADPDNIIALAWNDLNPLNSGSSIRYFTTGSPPNRKLIINYSTSHYGGTSYPFIVQAVLYETSNIIDIHTTVISDASSFDPAATTTQGLENSDGSSGVFVPGRNGTVFSASNDAYRFSPFIPYSYFWNPGGLVGQSQSVVPVSTGAYMVTVSDGTPCMVNLSTPNIDVETGCTALHLKIFIEGYYVGSGQMAAVLQNEQVANSTSAETDTIFVELHDVNDPLFVVDATTAILYTDGRTTCKFTNATLQTPYWLVVKHRNGLQTWSSAPVELAAGNNVYDFSTSASNAFGANQIDVLGEGIWSVYSGDINQDEFIDIFDFPLYDQDNQSFVNGVYVNTDLNGDGYVDIFDFPIFDRNNQNFIMSLHP